MLSSPSTDHRSRTTNRRIPWVIAAVTIAVLLVAAPRALPAAAPTGDQDLGTRIGHGPEAPAGNFAAAVIEDGKIDFAGRGADEHTAFELGSISKVFGGLLLADAIDRGEVSADTTLGEILGYPADGSGAITLQQLATHTSGLPRLPLSVPFYAKTLASIFANSNPYTQSVDDVIELGRTAHPKADPGFAYSNFGAALLGQALARVTGTSYPALVAERITGPLGMDRTWVEPLDAASASADRGTAPRLATASATGHRATGHVAGAWPAGGFAPALAIHSTAGDLSLRAHAGLGGTPPGTASVNPGTADDSGGQGGLAWMTTAEPVDSPASGEVVWHNGMTGGFASYLGLLPDGERAVVVLSATARGVDEAGLGLLDGGSR
ncbi:MAG: beta-lactamase family protein [Micrococcaceae bacterium]|nr:beta-lactamase family protein [Micrococcaceae bacterium]